MTLNQLLHEVRWRRCWRVLLWACAATSAYFAFAPPSAQPVLTLSDKLNHLAAFSAMGFAAALARPPSSRQLSQAAAWLLAYGCFIELVQSVLPMRSADPADVVADAVGVALGLLAATLARQLWHLPAKA